MMGTFASIKYAVARLLRKERIVKCSAMEAARRLQAERETRWGQVMDRWNELAGKAATLMDEADLDRVNGAIEQTNRLTGPYDPWLRDLVEGRCRLPEVSAQAMGDLLLPWLHPQAEGGIVCTACGLEYPRHKYPPLSEWKLLPGKHCGEGPPPWYDLPEFFTSCPHCGGSPYGAGVDWPHLVAGKTYSWMDRDGYVGKPIRDTTSQNADD
jgi:hypothetical protein